MATITVRDLDDEVRRRLKHRATLNNRSMEAEVRAILSAAVAPKSLAHMWLEAASTLRGADVPLPERSQPREVHLT